MIVKIKLTNVQPRVNTCRYRMRIPEDLQKEFGEKKMIKRGEAVGPIK
jgi:hypothetical protein